MDQEIILDDLLQNLAQTREKLARSMLHPHVEHGGFCMPKGVRSMEGTQLHNRPQRLHEPLTAEISQHNVSILSQLGVCAKQKDLRKGSRLHEYICKWGLLGKDAFVGTALVNMYAKCGVVAKAQEVFDELFVRDVVSWSALILGYAQHGHGYPALNCLECMQHEGLLPNAFTFSCALKACANIKALEKGQKIHAEILTQRLLRNDIVLSNALIDMYAKCGTMSKAQQVFDELPIHDLDTWNALIAGYAQNDHGSEAMRCFQCFESDGFLPDDVTFACIIKACGSIGDAKKGKELHDEVIKQGLLETNVIVGNALVDMYAKCRELERAQEVFDSLPILNVVSWNAIIGGYARWGFAHEMLNCFECMQFKGFSPDIVTFASLLKVCGNIGAAQKGDNLYAEVVRLRLLEKHSILGHVFVDMFAKCGTMTKAQEVFNKLPIQDVITWSALIAGYAQLGNLETVFVLFMQMLGEGIEANLVTSTMLLDACNHAGLIDQAEMILVAMNTCYNLTPNLEQYTCMVDIFGRAGLFQKALEIMVKLPSRDICDQGPVWTAVLAACLRWNNVTLGKLAFEHLMFLDGEDTAAFISMSNMYASTCM